MRLRLEHPSASWRWANGEAIARALRHAKHIQRHPRDKAAVSRLLDALDGYRVRIYKVRREREWRQRRKDSK